MNEKLDSLRHQLSAFEFKQCGMLHERVQRVPGSEAPMRNASAEHGYLRFEYCSSDLRRNRLACAHTTARTSFGEILYALPRQVFGEETLTRWEDTLQELDMLIIQVDWEKSDMELRHARECDVLSDGTGDKDAMRQAASRTSGEIQGLVDRHNEYVTRLEKLRDEVLAAVEAAIPDRS